MTTVGRQDTSLTEYSNHDVTVLLNRIQNGDDEAKECLFRELQRELQDYASKLMRQERVDHTLNSTALINEACVRILEQDVLVSVNNRRHLFGVASEVMRRILVEHARVRSAQKRGGNAQRHPLDVVIDNFESNQSATFLELDEALTSLGKDSQRQLQVVELRFFSGLTIAETAEVLGYSSKTIEAEWRLARAKLYRALHGDKT